MSSGWAGQYDQDRSSPRVHDSLPGFVERIGKILLVMSHGGENVDAGLHSLLTDARQNLPQSLGSTFNLVQR